MAIDLVSRGGNFSVVENYNENEGYKCGYCKSKTSNYSHGMWAHQLTVHDYQDLIDRGWRRSGNYCYKPTMQKICCPMYTIKCNAADFKISKSQKKVIKRMNRFLAHGERGKHRPESDDPSSSGFSEVSEGHSDWMEAPHLASEEAGRLVQIKSSLQQLGGSNTEHEERGTHSHTGAEEVAEMEVDVNSGIPAVPVGLSSTSTDGKHPKLGDGPDEGKPLCKKAKVARLERRQQKLAQQGLTVDTITNRKKNDSSPKTLEDLLLPASPQNPAHRLQVRLVRSQPPSAEFKNSVADSFNVYRRYQMTIHRDPDSKCTESQYKRFLVRSPLEPWRPADESGPPHGYGSFHQQYWLDDKLIAVGVVDILPRCVSSVYFYYDPDYSDLTLGTYGSLREVAFVRTLNLNAPELKWYYMGFYIHSCLKMRYKAALSPSMLLCPETYTWHPVERCLPLLDKEKYCRLEPDPNAVDANLLSDVNEVVVLYNLSPMYYGQYCKLKGSTNESEDEEVIHYAELVGKTCAKRMFLWR